MINNLQTGNCAITANLIRLYLRSLQWVDYRPMYTYTISASYRVNEHAKNGLGTTGDDKAMEPPA
jgi:hypothetical protein